MRIIKVIFGLMLAAGALGAVAPPAQAQQRVAPPGGGQMYTFEKGDTLDEIAEQFGVTTKAIMKANGLYSSKRVIPGTVLTIPTTPDAVSPAIAREINPQPTDGKVIYISLSEQRMWAYDGDQLAFEFLVSTGLPTEENPNRDTKPGVFRIKTKMPEAYARLWGLRMPYWMGIYDSGNLENGIHAMPYLNNGRLVSWRVGSRGSYGCVVLKGDEMAKLYRWAPFGTLVVIRS
jgi:LysM repeat protein